MNSASENNRTGSVLSRLWGNLAVRVFVCLLAAMTTLVILQNFFFIHFRQQAIDDLMIKESQVLTSLLADNVRLGVFSENRDFLEVPVAAILKQEDVLEVVVMDRDGRILFSNCREDEGTGDCGTEIKAAWAELGPKITSSHRAAHSGENGALIFAAPVMTRGGGDETLYFDGNRDVYKERNLLGFAAIAFDTNLVEVSRQNVLTEGIAMTAVFFFLVATATWLIVRAATRPFSRLIKIIRDSDIQVEAPDEIGLLSESLSSMIEQVSNSFATINRLKSELEELTSELIRTQEQERNELAFDLHDNIAQELSSLKIYCGNIEKEWPDAPETVAAELERMSSSLMKCINAVRELSYDLRPPGLRQLGFAPTIEQLCNEFSETTNIKVDLLITGFDGFEPEHDLAINCYRITQEALSNIKKHARASRVEIRILKSYPDMILRIKDDGVGFDIQARAAETVTERRMGLKNMEKRATLAGGSMTIESYVGKGTRIMVELPCGERSNE